MPLLNNIVSSIKIGWANLNNDDNLTMLTFLSVSYVFLIFLHSDMLSNSIFSEQVQLFGITSVPATTLFIIILASSSCVSLFVGAFFSKKYSHRLQLGSALIGLAFSFLLYLPLKGELFLCVYAILAGIVSTIGFANLLAAFINKTDFSNRGSTSGIFIFMVYVILFIFMILLGELRELAIVLVILKIFSLFLSARIKDFNFDSESKEYIMTSDKIKISFLGVWAIFIVSDIAVVTYLNFLQSIPIYFPIPIEMLSLISQIIGLVTMVIGGIVMDIYGRKRPMMLSFVYLGANYALISFSRGILNWFTAVDGIAWGILSVLFILILWGDICKPSKRTMWMAASLSISIMIYPGTVVAPYILSLFSTIGTVDQNALFPITSFFLFIAAGIILTLPETLPEKIIQKKELEDYIKMAKRVKEKYKNGKKI